MGQLSTELGPVRPIGEVVRRIREGGPALIALSGGVDSAVVASLAFEALGRHALAVTLTSSSVPPREVEMARAVARAVGVEHAVVEAEPLVSEEYRRNDASRCYHCRTVQAGELRTIGERSGHGQLLDGVQLDDLREERPGLRAMEAAGFSHPLLWAGWAKSEVREEARRRALPNWDRPSDACLASRVAHGERITSELLERISRAEEVLLAEGFRRVRVRARGGEARLEVDPSEVARLSDPGVLRGITPALLRLGFQNVVVDPDGYHGGLAALPVLR